MIERPILFSAPMVRAVLAGRKSQTRRVIRLPFSRGWLGPCPYGIPGHSLWVKETWARHPDGDGVVYRATDPGWDDEGQIKWRPSIYMPRTASRITLETTGVRAERLQDISERDAMSEGVERDGAGWRNYYHVAARDSFASLWDSINGKRAPWASNPWVWVVTFARKES